MSTAAVLVIVVIAIALLMFVTDKVPSDLTAILAMVVLVGLGIISPREGIAGFSNPATITVAFMFVISAALLKTGALQYLALHLSGLFRKNFMLGMLAMMLLIAVVSAFVNNTPVVAVFIPVVLQIAHASGQPAGKMLIPLSFASIFGGLCTMIGTSTNLLVSGIAEKEGLPPIAMFDFTPLALIFLVIGIAYMALIGIRLLPTREQRDNIRERYDLRNFLAEIELLDRASAVNQRIMDTVLVNELGIDIIEVKRSESVIHMPPGDFFLHAGDVLKVRCDVGKLKSLKERERIAVDTGIRIGEDDLRGKNSTLIEMVITANSAFSGKSLRQVDFRRRYRGIPLGICHRDEVVSGSLYDVELQPGDVVLAEVKNHYVTELRKLETGQNPPFVLLSEDQVVDFDKQKFFTVLGVVAVMVALAATGLLDIVIGAIGSVLALVALRCITMPEVYRAVNWKIVFLMAGVLSFGTAMVNTGLDLALADSLVGPLGAYGPVAVLSGVYLATMLLTEIMSNTAAAALMTPIAIATAVAIEVNTTPFLIAVMFAASASFATPIGYQTNTMVYSAGQYKFLDFTKAGSLLNLLFWLVATLTIPFFFPFQ